MFFLHVRIAEVLVSKGVPQTDIVLGFQPQAMRAYLDYAAA
ncbi:MAG: XisI protein [Saprospiraceae bacterium]|nr:XisI protein [Saprospiraceae bacterium]